VWTHRIILATKIFVTAGFEQMNGRDHQGFFGVGYSRASKGRGRRFREIYRAGFGAATHGASIYAFGGPRNAAGMMGRPGRGTLPGQSLGHRRSFAWFCTTAIPTTAIGGKFDLSVRPCRRESERQRRRRPHRTPADSATPARLARSDYRPARTHLKKQKLRPGPHPALFREVPVPSSGRRGQPKRPFTNGELLDGSAWPEYGMSPSIPRGFAATLTPIQTPLALAAIQKVARRFENSVERHGPAMNRRRSVPLMRGRSDRAARPTSVSGDSAWGETHWLPMGQDVRCRAGPTSFDGLDSVWSSISVGYRGKAAGVRPVRSRRARDSEPTTGRVLGPESGEPVAALHM